MRLQVVRQITDIPAECWDALFPSAYPFTTHAFLNALEQGGSVTALRGWQPYHLAVFDNKQLIAAAPGYLKSHSYGEYLFDWMFAEAYQAHGQPYYPKWVGAIPFTPCAGPRVGFRNDLSSDDERQALQLMTLDFSVHGIHSQHFLYPEQTEFKDLPTGWIARHDIQFHWYNNDYNSFDDFLAQLTSRKRKSIRRERQRVRDAKITIEWFSGNDISDKHWHQFYQFYQITYAKRSGHGGYLTLETFLAWAERCPQLFSMVVATHEHNAVAAALFVQGENTLYGRYWGALEEFHSLHFECCYYQGIDYCIAHQLRKFDAGAQGEHKLMRGFEPRLLNGFIRVADTDFQIAIEDYCQRQTQTLKAHQQQLASFTPFKL